MKNLDKALSTMTLEQLKVSDKAVSTTRLEPTKDEIQAIVTLLKDGKSYKEIKKTYRRVIMDKGVQISAQGFSIDQIAEIDLARQVKIAELEAKLIPTEVK